jgi:2-dehydropantoate 2-reductase
MNRVAVMGAGAVGCYFGGMLARKGAEVTLIARGPHQEVVARDGLFIDSINFQEKVSVRSSSDPAAAKGADLVLFCVKTLDTETASRALAPHLSPNAVVLSLQNGVDNAERIRAIVGREALPTVVYVAASIPQPGRVRHAGRGDLVIGDSPRETAAAIAAAFEGAGVPCKQSDNVQGELWQKLVLNCASNAVTALAPGGYAAAARNPFTRQMMTDVVEETDRVARAAGVRMPVDKQELTARLMKLFESYGTAVSSTAQDIAKKKRSEIDALNGYVAKRGQELGVPAPVNQTLHALIKLIEDSFQ